MKNFVTEKRAHLRFVAHKHINSLLGIFGLSLILQPKNHLYLSQIMRQCLEIGYHELSELCSASGIITLNVL